MSTSVVNFTRGMPPADVFPVDDLVRAGESALRNDPAVLLQYGRSPGYKPLRELLGSWYGVGPDQILIGNSSLEIIDFIARTKLPTSPRPARRSRGGQKPGRGLGGLGRRAFVEAPSYDRTITAFHRAGAEVVGIPLQSDGVDLEALEQELKAGPPAVFYIVADFQNPMGTTTSLEKRQQIARWAAQYDFWIIEDAPYRRLRYWGLEVPTLYSFAPDRTYHLCSFSKTLAPGLRLGYTIATPEAIANLAGFAVDTYIGPVFPTQGTVYEYCRAGLLDPNIEKLKALYAPRLSATLEALERYLPGATWTHPEGGFYVGVTLPEGGTMERLLPRAADAGLKLSDGRGFYPNPSDGNRFLRIPFCSVTPADIHAGIARLAELIEG